MLSDWRSPTRPDEKSAEQESRITGDTGKSVEDDRVSEGFEVVKKRSNTRGAKEPYCLEQLQQTEGKGEMTKAPISLQELRRSLYVKAKAEPDHRCWGLYVHICKMETLHEAYEMAKRNNGAPGVDGVTFEVMEESGVEGFLRQIRN